MNVISEPFILPLDINKITITENPYLIFNLKNYDSNIYKDIIYRNAMFKNYTEFGNINIKVTPIQVINDTQVPIEDLSSMVTLKYINKISQNINSSMFIDNRINVPSVNTYIGNGGSFKKVEMKYIH